MQGLLLALAAIFVIGFSTGNFMLTLKGFGVFVGLLLVQAVVWIPFVGNQGWLRAVPPLNLFLFSRELPQKFQQQLGDYKPLPAALDHKNRKPSADLATKVVGTCEYYVIKPSAEFSAPEKAVELEVQTMLEMSTIPNSKNLPETFQGVFWMKGNAMAEELVVLGLATWDQENLMLTRISSVGTWSWHDTPNGYTVAQAANEGAWDDKLGAPGGMTYFKFANEKFEEGRLWTSYSYKYDDVSWLYSLGHFSLEKPDFEGRKVNYYRGCYWGGEYIKMDRGSYDLTRITTLDGKPVQPGYDEYVAYRKGLGSGTLFFKGPKPNGSKKES